MKIIKMSDNKTKEYAMSKAEISLTEIFRVILRRRWIMIGSVLLFIMVALLYNFIEEPVYQSTVLLKKEVLVDENNPQDRIQNLLGYLSQDEVETEMQLVQTRSVINSVIEELSLNVLLSKIIEQDGTVTIINLPLSEYQNYYNLGLYSDKFPQIEKIKMGLNSEEDSFVISTSDSSRFIIRNENKTIEEIFEAGEKNVGLKKWEFEFNWPNKTEAGEIYFKVFNYSDVFESVSEQIFVDKRIKTNIFEVTVNSNYAYTTKKIANTLTQKYKAYRFLQNKDNIKYSSTFIDERLNDISKNLEDAEDTLSRYKTTEKIADIDEQSKNIVQFLSNLESEKLKTDLELSTYNNKINNIAKQMKSEGFVDQTYLTPVEYQSYNSPFSTSLNELARLELAKLELLQRRTELHPDVKSVSEQIKKIKRNLTKYNKNTLNAIKIISNSLINKQSDLNKLIVKYTSQLQKLPEHESKLAGLIRDRDGLEKMYNLLLDKREEMRVAELSMLQDIIVLDSAIEPTKPVSPNKKLNLLVAIILGLLLGLVMVFIVNFNDKKISDIYDIERNYNYPILSVIPPYEKKQSQLISTTDVVKNRFVTMMENQFKYKEAYRTFETKLTSKIKGSTKTVMITSCEENAGKTTVATNLAITIAQTGKKVLLIDCDIKKPSIADQFGLPNFSSGLLDYLTEKTDTPNIYKPIKLTKNSNLLMNIDIIPTGTFSNVSGEILASERMKKLFKNFEYYDFVILDTPPITKLSDALSLGRLVKDTVLVVRAKQTVKDSISWAIGELQTSDINFLGLLVNDCDVNENSYKYQYGYSKS
jgi:tyrosine-protein kinase Etk/Wzc